MPKTNRLQLRRVAIVQSFQARLGHMIVLEWDQSHCQMPAFKQIIFFQDTSYYMLQIISKLVTSADSRVDWMCDWVARWFVRLDACYHNTTWLDDNMCRINLENFYSGQILKAVKNYFVDSKTTFGVNEKSWRPRLSCFYYCAALEHSAAPRSVRWFQCCLRCKAVMVGCKSVPTDCCRTR